MSLLLKDVQKGNLAYNKIRDLILGMIDPLAFIVIDQQTRDCGHGSANKDVSMFLRWLRPQMEEFMKYETHSRSPAGSQ
ncbi:hypothetical protein PPTG_20751 [Phytophthora nicotianae INRA-310]|uniref:Uncharacterized protein n=1 Tax=Phytophthora nicotianae (strain INRA-310) TaxID=761204 RepID=W2RH92_PHYN3|nr:hypothetical protein PPTG_20751 [Phytophthora nicotianae INRA-310]ETN24034.1 hypothetical protein PPTG_20751 [Phytophthora nicotianae INRA-310]